MNSPRPTKIAGAWIWTPEIKADLRGFFLESWRKGPGEPEFVQDNHSRSARGVLRGLHYQAGEAAQGKLVWVTSGEVYDVIVDLRQSSPTFGQWESFVLGATAHARLFVPAGCAHGFLVLSESADFHYKVTKPRDPEAERCLQWDDKDLGIPWPRETGVQPILSEKDRAGLSFKECEKYL